MKPSAFIGRGSLIETVNKHSEAANRKYRAFIHFLKYQKRNSAVKKGPASPRSGNLANSGIFDLQTPKVYDPFSDN